MTGSLHGDNLPAAKWAEEQNAQLYGIPVETDQDRIELRNGIRCALVGGPYDGFAEARPPEDQLAAGGQGYAPEIIDIPMTNIPPNISEKKVSYWRVG